jgi:hypothetical protein
MRAFEGLRLVHKKLSKSQVSSYWNGHLKLSASNWYHPSYPSFTKATHNLVLLNEKKWFCLLLQLWLTLQWEIQQISVKHNSYIEFWLLSIKPWINTLISQQSFLFLYIIFAPTTLGHFLFPLFLLLAPVILVFVYFTAGSSICAIPGTNKGEGRAMVVNL